MLYLVCHKCGTKNRTKTLSSIFITPKALNIAAPSSYRTAGIVNKVNMTLLTTNPAVAHDQWLEHLTTIQKVMDSIPTGDSDSFLSPTLVTY